MVSSSWDEQESGLLLLPNQEGRNGSVIPAVRYYLGTIGRLHASIESTDS